MPQPGGFSQSGLEGSGPQFTCELPTWDFTPEWDFTTGKGLDAQGLTAWQASYSALTLVTTLAGVNIFQDAFATQVSIVRAGRDPLQCAVTYLPRNATVSGRRDVLANIFSIAAETRDHKEMVNRLIRACNSPITERHVASADGLSTPEDGDRQKAFRPQWRHTVTRGARLLGLRGSLRCIGCEELLKVEEMWSRPLADRERRVRLDYCPECMADDLYELRLAPDRNAIRSVLDAAAPALAAPAILDGVRRPGSVSYRAVV